MLTAAIIVAAGRGARASGAGAKPKQYLPLAGRPVLCHSLGAFLDHDAIGAVLCVIHPDDRAHYDDAVAGKACEALLAPVAGGRNRQQSVLAGLRALQPVGPDRVLIHDAARPLVSKEVIDGVLAGLDHNAACLAALPLSDTLKAENAGLVARTIERSGLWRAQTPQGFHYRAIFDAHAAAAAEGREDFTDDAAIAEWRGIEVALATGSERNIKLTTAEDFELAERLLSGEAHLRETRTATGFDVHSFEPGGDEITLCGVVIPHAAALAGHSDADVGLHALTDALLGTICAGDIGEHFPPSEPKWKGAASRIFLAHAARLLAEAGARILHVDVTLICERPKIGPYRAAMRASIGDILGIGPDRVSVKATTTEGLGFTGRSEGIAAMASATVELTVKGDQDA
jgi:2-C-methyl-D-erythritol 4-phosphate cytidylyltransferase/2-C-methyl-D-erythritol 2,4-cyclodiphosphate synthase